MGYINSIWRSRAIVIDVKYQLFIESSQYRKATLVSGGGGGGGVADMSQNSFELLGRLTETQAPLFSVKQFNDYVMTRFSLFFSNSL